MWPDRVSNPGPLALESDALPTALRGPAKFGLRVLRELRGVREVISAKQLMNHVERARSFLLVPSWQAVEDISLCLFVHSLSIS